MAKPPTETPAEGLRRLRNTYGSLLTKRQAATLLEVSERTLERLALDGQGPRRIDIRGGTAKRPTWRYPEALLKRWIDQRLGEGKLVPEAEGSADEDSGSCPNVVPRGGRSS